MTLDELTSENVRLKRELYDAHIAYKHLQNQHTEFKEAVGKELQKRSVRIQILETALAKFRGSVRWLETDEALLKEGKL